MCIDDRPPPAAPGLRQAGVTLIELVLFIVIVSVAVIGILSVMNITSRHSADPMVRKQALAVAESLMEEITLQPFTYCDVSDANAATARFAQTAPVGTPADQLPNYCAAAVQGLGAGGKSRTGDPRFDNVGDYAGYAMNPIVDITNTAVGGLGSYSAAVVIAASTVGGVAAASGDALQIDVTVNGPGNTNVTLTGYRFRYAPRAVP